MFIFADCFGLMVDRVGSASRNVFGRWESWSVIPPRSSRMGPESTSYGPTLIQDGPLSLRAGTNNKRMCKDGLSRGETEGNLTPGLERNAKGREVTPNNNKSRTPIILSPDDDVARGSRDIPATASRVDVKTEAVNE